MGYQGSVGGGNTKQRRQLPATLAWLFVKPQCTETEFYGDLLLAGKG